MNTYGVILKNLRSLNQLTLKQAAKHLNKSSGWLSEIENDKGRAKITPDEFERIVKAYDGEKFKRHFGLWVSQEKKTQTKEVSFNGPILKYLRIKANLTLAEAAKRSELSKSYLSYLENGQKALSKELRDKLTRIYGYSPSSFKNFATEDKRGKNVPTRLKLNLLLKQLPEDQIENIFSYALNHFKT